MTGQRRPAAARGGWVAAAAVLLALVVAGVAARGPSWVTANEPAPQAPPSPSAPASPTAPPAVPSGIELPSQQSPLAPASPIAGWLMLILLLALGGLLVAVLARALAGALPGLRRRRSPAAPVASRDPRPLRAAAEQALVDVEQPDAREAVVRSWLLLGAAAAELGLPARPSETATEYARRIVDAVAVPVPELHRLAELYREARFSTHRVTEQQRAEARELLHRLSAALHDEVPT